MNLKPLSTLTRMNGVFAVEKPSGASSTKIVSDLQHIFTHSQVFAADLHEMRQKVVQNLSTDKSWSKERINKKANKLKIKIGHGGTLDPMASGVLVIGVGSGTKKLQYYLGECNKVYETKALLGISTTTGDAEGEILTKNEFSHIDKALVESTVEKFIGDIKQTPPIFSALKMNGKPLYDYAREGKPLPFPIKTRDIKIADIRVHKEDLLTTDHEFETLKSQLDENGQPKENLLFNNPTLNDSPLYFSKQYLEKTPEAQEPIKPKLTTEELPSKLPLVHFTCDVGSGTYIRSLISDIGKSMGSSAYMVELIRSKQSDWLLGVNTFKMSDFELPEDAWAPVLKQVFENGSDTKVSEIMEKKRQEYKENDTTKDTETHKKEKENEEANAKATEEDTRGVKRSIEEVV